MEWLVAGIVGYITIVTAFLAMWHRFHLMLDKKNKKQQDLIMEFPTRESCLDNWQRTLWDAAYKKGYEDALKQSEGK